jgi:hypothetical protein
MDNKISEILERLINIHRLLKIISTRQINISYAGMEFSPPDFTTAYDELINFIKEKKIKDIKIGFFDEKRIELCIETITTFLHKLSNSSGNSSGISSPLDLINFFTESYFLKNFLYRAMGGEIDVLIVSESELSGEKYRNYKNASQELQNSIAQIEEKSISAENILIYLENQKSKIESIENSILAAQSSVNSLEINTLSHATEVRNTLSKALNDSNKINETLSNITEIYTEIDNRRREVSELLENANKIGLAKSFGNRRREHTFAARGWFCVFSFGLICLSWVGFHEILPLLGSTAPDLTALGVRFILGAPSVWLTWFGARQYGHNLRLREDYAFKEAAAMAFVGYRNEMSQDADMLKLLQESAIKTFASNPSDAISKKDEAASPIHELLEKSLSRLEPQKIVDSITALLKKEKP